jgi:hypothetical protein
VARSSRRGIDRESKEWILDRLRELAGLVAIEVCGYSAMSNHLHLVLRNRPDIAGGWSADEIALRWCRVFPPRDDATGEPVEPGVHDLAMLANYSERLAELRQRLANLSWFMRCLCEKIAREANHEDGSNGRFWAGRFKAAGLYGAGTSRGQARGDSGSHGPNRGGAGDQSIEWGGNCARLRPTVQAGGEATELASRCCGAPLAALVPGKGGGSGLCCRAVANTSLQAGMGGFQRHHLPQHGTPGRVAQRLAQRPVGSESFHDVDRVGLLPP